MSISEKIAELTSIRTKIRTALAADGGNQTEDLANVAGSIEEITSNISNAYTAIGNKGGTVPTNKYSRNLSTAINSVTSVQYETNDDVTYQIDIGENQKLAKVNSIGGRTVNWNQLVQNGNFASTSNWLTSKTTITVTDNICTLTNDGTGSTGFAYQNCSYPTGHKYFVSINLVSTSAGTPKLFLLSSDWTSCGLNEQTLSIGKNSYLFTSTTSIGVVRFGVSGSTSGVAKFSNFMLVDLTTLYGSGNEPTTAQEFIEEYPNNYYAYDAGSLVSADVSAVTSVGTNILPVNFELGGYSSAGAKITSESIRSADAFAAQPSTTYRLSFTGTYSSSDIGALVIYYDASMTVVGRAYVAKGNTFTTSSATRYLNIAIYNGYGRTFNNDIVIHQSSVTVTTYIPYMSDTISIPSTLRTAYPLHSLVDGSVYDEYNFEEMKHIQRVSISGTTVTELSTPVETDISSYFTGIPTVSTEESGTITFTQTQSPTLQIPQETILKSQDGDDGTVESKTVTVTTIDKLVILPSSEESLSNVVVQASDNNLVASNIKKDVSIFGVTGTYEAEAYTIYPQATEPSSAETGDIWVDYSSEIVEEIGAPTDSGSTCVYVMDTQSSIASSSTTQVGSSWACTEAGSYTLTAMGLFRSSTSGTWTTNFYVNSSSSGSSATWSSNIGTLSVSVTLSVGDVVCLKGQTKGSSYTLYSGGWIVTEA